MAKTVTIPGYDMPIDFPDSMSQEQINAASKKLYEDKHKPAPSTPSGPADWRDPYTEIQPHKMPTAADNATFGSRAQYVGREAATGIGNIGAGGLSVFLRPVQTAKGVGQFLAHPLTGAKQFSEQFVTPEGNLAPQALEHAESMLGQSTAMGAAGEVTHGVGRVISKTFPRLSEALTKTGPKQTSELVKKTSEENELNSAKVSKSNKDNATQRKIDLRKHFEKTQEAKKANVQAKAPVERKVALNRGVEHLDTQFQSDLKATAEKVRKEASGKYDSVRSATQGQTVPSDQLASAVREAESKIQGSSENLKIFRDILSKHPEEAGEIMYQGAKIPKGHPRYDVLNEGVDKPPATFSDLQGYYTEIGDKLAPGNLPGDVYLAMRSLHENVGNLMQQMADRSGVGPQFSEARNFYRQYMQTFRDHNSPLYKALKATERGKSIASLSGKDQTGIQALARYNPELAQKANTIRGYQSEARSIPSKPKALKSLPKLEPKLSPISPEVKTVDAEDIRGAKQEGMQNRADFINKRGGQIAVTFGVYRMLENVIHGNLSALPEDFAGAVAGYGITQAIGMLLENPKVVEFLTRPTERDLAQVPPEMRGDMSKIAEIAAKKGIKLDPRFLAKSGAFAGAVGGPNQPKKSVASALSYQSQQAAQPVVQPDVQTLQQQIQDQQQTIDDQQDDLDNQDQ